MGPDRARFEWSRFIMESIVVCFSRLALNGYFARKLQKLRGHLVLFGNLVFTCWPLMASLIENRCTFLQIHQQIAQLYFYSTLSHVQWFTRYLSCWDWLVEWIRQCSIFECQIYCWNSCKLLNFLQQSHDQIEHHVQAYVALFLLDYVCFCFRSIHRWMS